MKKNEIKLLSEREHVLLRPARYIGSINTNIEKQWCYNKENNTLELKEKEYNPGLKKIFREILDNSIDEYVRTNGKFANKLKITLNLKNNEIILEDNGRGIPFSEHTMNKKKHYGAELAWTRLKAGSNFEDSSDNKTLGQNGEGASLTNIMSLSFKGETCDGTKKVTVICSDNMKNIESKVTKGTKKFTRVSFTPDLKQFKMESIPTFLIDSLIVDFMTIVQIYSKMDITFTLINEKGKKEVQNFNSNDLDFKSFVSLFVPTNLITEELTHINFMEIIETEGLKIGVLPNHLDSEQIFHSINGLMVKSGNPLNWVTTSVGKNIVEKMVKKYKNIKIGDTKLKLTWIVLFDKMTNPRFDSQTKESCVNTFTEFKENIVVPDFDLFVTRLYRKKNIIEPLIETQQTKNILEERKSLKELKPEKKRIFIEKYYKSSGNYNKDKISLVLVEGDSALQGVIDTLGRENYSYFPLKGKPLNVYEESNKVIVKNKEIKSILQILDIDVTKENDTMKYDSVIITTDADPDGQHIAGLLLSFFHKFTPHLIKEGKIKLFRTPMIVATKKTNQKNKHLIYNFDELFEFEKKNNPKDFEMQYYKGLGSWEEDNLQKLIEKYGIDNFIIPFYYENNIDKLIDNWFSKNTSDYRKEQIRNIQFSIEKA